MNITQEEIRNGQPVTLIAGHCLDVLRGLLSESVHCCVTSPPYWGLRDYQTPGQVWGGSVDCNHVWQKDGLRAWQSGQFCMRCNAWSGNLGLEPTPELYTKHLVMIFREVRRTLKDSGTCRLLLGDCYGGLALSDGIKLKDVVGIPVAGGVRVEGRRLVLAVRHCLA